MTTQLLFGEMFEILQGSGPWLKIRIDYDGYEGWIDFKQVRFLDRATYRNLAESTLYISRRNSLDYVVHGDEKIHLPAGCSIYQPDNQSFSIDQEDYTFHGICHRFEYTDMANLLSTARGYLSCPYLWGGKTFMGIDCSGFTQVVFKQHGIKLLRDAIEQSVQGELINLLSEGTAGDLAFFDHDDGVIVHVGILVDQGHIIHCSGKVRIDPVDHYGIFNSDLKRYTHSLRLIRRLV